MLHHLLLLVLLAIHGAMADDAMVLWTFKKTSILLDQRNSLQNWIGVGAAVCSWTGVTCGTDGHVTGLNLANLGLSGRLIIGDLMALPALATIDLSGNSFYGDLSYSSTACSFVSVDLSRNNFTGKITSNFLTICPHLISLNLSRNSITGGIYPIPSTLQSLDVSDNRITDVALLTNSLTLCGAMKYLNFSSNRLPGGLSVPEAPCTGIVVFDLSNNPFSVPLPAGLVAGMPPTLTTLNLARCNISGDLTKADFGACRSLTSVDFSGNLLAGGPPASLANCRSLEFLDLSNNRLSGGISKFFFNLTSLKRLSLSGNTFSGEIPPDLATLCRTIVELDLSGNLITGELPPSFSDCPALQILNLSRNYLSGNFVATVIPTLPSIRMLSVSFNNISGPTPLPQLRNCTKLEEIDLGSNALTGTLPMGLCASLSSLRRLLLPNNYITGELPRDIADCGVLMTIDLSFNFLSGKIPAEILTMPMMKDIVMWANNFTGEIPDVLCSKGSTLEVLVLNHNSLTGRIPGSMTRCSNLKWVNLAGNRLTGSIPKTIGDMKRLGLLQLGNNELSGEIPEELGLCTNLMWVELSSNKLTGSIPATLSAQTGKVTPPFVGFKFAFLRNEAGTSCPGSGFMFEFEGIRPERLAAYEPVHLCPWTRIYTGSMMSPFRSNGSILYLDLSYNLLSGQIPESLGIMPYLIVLNLGHNQLTGSIPRSIGGLKSVGVIDLSYNKLSGPIPAEIGSLSFLNDLDLSNNNLSGTIPTSGQFMTFPASRFANNTFLCGSPLPPCSSSSSTFMAWRSSKRRLLGTMVIGITVCTLILLSLLLLLFKIKRRQNKTEKHMSFVESLSRTRNDPWVLHGPDEPLSINVAMFGKDHLRKLTFGHLVEATNGFSSETLIGSGGFGEVYKAKLKDGSAVAIKKLIHVANQGDREFMAEMETIGKIKHRNLVPLLGYCKVGDERLLVYQFMMHGSLDDVLHGGGVLGERTPLDWPTRKKIAIGAGKGLAFLHHTCIPHIIHRDMKSSNVLVDEDMEARVSDFGMARLVNALDTHLSVSSLSGTPGYVPPEYYQSFRCTTRGDVYSFGVVLLELLSGKRPTGLVEFGDSNLVGWAKQLIRDDRAMEVFDKEIVADNAELEKWLKLTLHCLEDRPNRRPTMAQVVVKFKEFLQESGQELVDSEESLESVELDEEPRESV